jgi:hypothetical protein
MSTLTLKLFLVPALIYIVTLIGRRWGPGVAGWFSALPIVSGPILLVMAIEQGTDFASVAAGRTVLAVAAILVFSLAYTWSAVRMGITGSMTVALLAYAAAVAGLQALALALDAAQSFLLVVCLLIVTPRLFPAMPPASVSVQSGKRINDLPVRMLAGAALSVSVTWAAAQLGPRLSGFMAMFPVMSTILVGFSHHASGRDFAVNLLRGMVRGYYAFAAFCLVLSLALRDQGLPLAFGMAVLVALVVQVLSRRGVANVAIRASVK